MHTQLRLAERQGLLRSARINSVQHKALQLLDSAESVDKAKNLRRELHGHLAAMGWDRFKEMFSDYVNDPSDDAEVDEVLDDAEARVRYEAGMDEMDEERFKELLGKLMDEGATGSLNGAQAEGSWL